MENVAVLCVVAGEAGGECGCVVVGEAGGECGCVVAGEAGGECGCVVCCSWRSRWRMWLCCVL